MSVREEIPRFIVIRSNVVANHLGTNALIGKPKGFAFKNLGVGWCTRGCRVKYWNEKGTRSCTGHGMSPCWRPWVCQRLFYTIHVLYKHIQS